MTQKKQTAKTREEVFDKIHWNIVTSHNIQKQSCYHIGHNVYEHCSCSSFVLLLTTDKVASKNYFPQFQQLSHDNTSHVMHHMPNGYFVVIPV